MFGEPIVRDCADSEAKNRSRSEITGRGVNDFDDEGGSPPEARSSIVPTPTFEAAQRGLSVYGDDATRPEFVEDLRKRVIYAIGKIENG